MAFTVDMTERFCLSIDERPEVCNRQRAHLISTLTTDIQCFELGSSHKPVFVGIGTCYQVKRHVGFAQEIVVKEVICMNRKSGRTLTYHCSSFTIGVEGFRIKTPFE